MVSDKLADVERPKLGNAYFKHPIHPQMVLMDPSDNLPRPTVVSSMTDTAAPPLSPETLICMGDESEFVIRDRWGDAIITVQRDIVRRSFPTSYSYGWSVKRSDLTEDQILSLQQAGLLISERRRKAEMFGEDPNPDFVDVEPLRPSCSHYRRVMTDFEGNQEHRHVERVCAAQKSESGEYTSLSDLRVYACEHRNPRDFVSEERLRRFDEKRIEEGKKTEEEWVPPDHGEKNG